MTERMPLTSVSFLGASTLKALAELGYTHVEDLDGANIRDLICTRGLGRRKLGALTEAAAERGVKLVYPDEPEKEPVPPIGPNRRLNDPGLEMLKRIAARYPEDPDLQELLEHALRWN